MAYTGGEIVDLTTGALVGSTIANTTVVGSDTYARRLNVSGAEVTVTDLKVSSGGSIYLYDGIASNTLVTGKNDIFYVNGGLAEDTVVSAAGSMEIVNTGRASNVSLTGVGGTPRIVVGNGGVASHVEVSNTNNVEVYLNANGTIYDLTAGTAAWTYIAGGLLSGGTLKGSTLQITGGTLSGVTIYKNKLRSDAQGWKDQMQAGTMIDCTLATSTGASGAVFRQTGGANNNFTVTGSGAVFYASGGTVNGVTVTKSGTIELGNAAVVNDLHAVNGGMVPTVRVSSGGTINRIDNDGVMQIYIYNSGTVNDMMLGTGAYVFVTNGAVVSGGSTWGVTLEINGANTVVEDLTILKPTQRGDQYAGNDQLKAGTMSNCTLAVRAGASGAVYRQTGGTNIGMTVTGSGAVFNVSGGTLTGMTLTSGGSVNATGGSFTDTTVESNGILFASAGEFTDLTLTNKGSAFLRGATVNNLQMVNGGSIPRLYLSSGTVVNGGETTGTVEFWVFSGGVAKDVTLNDGAYVITSSGATLSGGTFNGTMLEIMGGTVRGLSIIKTTQGTVGRNMLKGGQMIDCTIAAGGQYAVSGGTATDTKVSGTLNISKGVVDGVTVYDGGRANISAAATGVVESGGYVNIVNNAAVTFVDTVLDNHTFSKAATLHSATTANNATVASGGALYVMGGTADGVTVNNGGMLSAYAAANGTHGTIEDVTLNSGATLELTEGVWSWGEDHWATVDGITVNEGGKINLKNFTRLMNVNAVTGAVLNRESNLIGVGGENTNIAKGVFRIKATGAEDKSLGEDFEVVNGVATGLALNGNGVTPRSCFLAYDGLTVKNATVISGGTLYLFNGAAAENLEFYGRNANSAFAWISGATVSGAKIGVGARGSAYNGAVLNDLNISGGAVDIFSGVTADNVSLVSGAGVRGTLGIGTGATVNTLNLGIKGELYINGGTVNNLIVDNGGNTPTFYVYNGGTVVGGKTTGTCEVRASNGGVISGMDIGADAYVHIRSTGSAAGVLSDCVFNGYRLNVYEGGVIKDVTIIKTAAGEALNALRDGKMIDCTIASGAQYKMSGGVAENTLVNGTFIIRGGVASDLHTTGRNARVHVSSGGTVSGALIEDLALIDVSSGGVLYDPVIRMNAPTSVAGSYARISVRAGGLVSGGRTEGPNTLEVYAWGGDIRDMTFNRGGYAAIYSGATVSGGVFNTGATINMRGGAVEGGTINGAAAGFQATGGTIRDVTVVSGTISVNNTGVVRNATLVSAGSMLVYAGAGEVTGTVVSSGARIIAVGGLADGVTLSSGGSAYLYASGGTVVNNLTAASGATIIFDFARVSGAMLDTPAMDSLANVADGTVISANSVANGITYKLAGTGNAALKMSMAYEYFTVNPEAGKTVVNAWGRQYTINAEGTTFLQEAYTLDATTEVADLKTSGAVINGGDKALRLNGATMTSGSAITFVTDAAGITGDAWLRFSAVNFDKGATVYGADNDFDGTMKYLIHGAGTLGNFAAGAKAGGKVGGVELVSYNNDYGLTYFGGQGTVTGLVSATIRGGNTLSKDVYAGALANYAKTRQTTGVGSIVFSIDKDGNGVTTVKGNVYGASQVKAGSITTTAATTALHTVGDVSVSLRDSTATKGDFCCFAAGYATGHDTANLAPVYTVGSVTLNVTAGIWGSAHGGRGIFGGAFAGDNTAAGDAGVWAKVGNVNLTISGGTMGNVYGGGWAQKGARSEVGDVNITITGGTMANVYGGGTHSGDGVGGTTVAGNVKITVSGGTITDDIYASGQLDGDTTGTAKVIFTGTTDFGCGVWGYSYAGGDNAATLTFDAYTGTFSGKIGGFDDGITLAGNTAMTLTSDDDDVSNSKWTFDAAERDAALAGTAFLNWSDGDFTGDTITLNLAGGEANAWDLVSTAGATVYNKFDVQIDGTSILSDLIDIDDAIAGTGTVYDGWGFTDDNGVLKFKHLA